MLTIQILSKKVFILIFILFLTAFQPLSAKGALSENAEEIEFIEKLIADNDNYAAIAYIQDLLVKADKIKKSELYELYTTAGSLYLNIDLQGKGKIYLKKAISVNPKRNKAFLLLQKISFQTGDNLSVIKYYDNLKKNVFYGNIPIENYYFTLIACFKTEDYEKFTKVLQDLPFELPSEIYSYIEYLKALVLLKTNSTSQAINVFNSLLSNKEYSQTLREKATLTLGMILFEEGRYQDSVNKLKGLIETPYEDEAIYVNIWNHIKLEKYDKAFNLIDDFLLINDNSVYYEDVLLIKGKMYLKNSQFEASLKSFENAEKKFLDSINFIKTVMMKKEYIDYMINLFTLADFPQFKYSTYFNPLTDNIKIPKDDSYSNGQRILKKILQKKNSHNLIANVSRRRKVIDALTKQRNKYQFFLNRYKFTINHFDRMINRLKENESVGKIDTSKVRKKMELQGTSVSYFATHFETLMLKHIDTDLEKTKRLLESEELDNEEFLNDSNKKPTRLFKSSKSTKSNKKEVMKYFLGNEDDNAIISGIEKEGNIQELINTKITTVENYIANMQKRVSKGQPLFWENDHEKMKGILSDINIIIRNIEIRLSKIKKDTKQFIFKKMEERKLINSRKGIVGNILENNPYNAFIVDIENESNNLILITEKIKIFFKDIASIKAGRRKSRKRQWRLDYKKNDALFANLNRVTHILESRVLDIKNNIILLSRIKTRKITFSKELDKIENDISKLKNVGKFFILHIQELKNEMKAVKDMLEGAKAATEKLIIENKKAIEPAKASFEKRIKEALEEEIKNYRKLIENNDIDIANSLFKISTGRK